MPSGERGGQVLGRLLPLAGGIILGLRLAVLLRASGYLICRAFKNDIDPNGAWIAVIGLLFWLALVAGAWHLYGHVSDFFAVDRCLDTGGAYDYQTGECVFS